MGDKLAHYFWHFLEAVYVEASGLPLIANWWPESFCNPTRDSNSPPFCHFTENLKVEQQFKKIIIEYKLDIDTYCIKI